MGKLWPPKGNDWFYWMYWSAFVGVTGKYIYDYHWPGARLRPDGTPIIVEAPPEEEEDDLNIGKNQVRDPVMMMHMARQGIQVCHAFYLLTDKHFTSQISHT
eukprot:GFYU01002200.1.p2 GENE.GFYU01002200.1~~GFYU01002200.1.p2  ORF type:complete len:102 (-),score=13.68 GFYU01002200.1:349-654(-)